MKLIKKALAAAAIGLLAPAASMATLVSSGSNDPLNFSWAYNTGASTLSGNGSMTITGFDTSMLTITVSLTNSSSIGGHGGERLTAFGFGIDPNPAAMIFADFNDGGIVNGSTTQNFPGYQTVDVCTYGGNNCAGGGNGGIYAGASDSFVVLLAGAWGSAVNIDPIALKYQTGYGSFEFTASTPTTGKLPEPSSLALAGLGFGLAGFAVRRRRQTAA